MEVSKNFQETASLRILISPIMIFFKKSAITKNFPWKCLTNISLLWIFDILFIFVLSNKSLVSRTVIFVWHNRKVLRHVSVKVKHLEGSIFMDCGSDLGSGRHVPGKGVVSSAHTSSLISISFKNRLEVHYLIEYFTRK